MRIKKKTIRKKNEYGKRGDESKLGEKKDIERAAMYAKFTIIPSF